MKKTIEDDGIYRCLRQESFSTARASLTITKKGKNVVFEAKGSDPSALKASTSALKKSIKIYEKMKNV
jgi:tRNA threonylcarbamoyladenosine modification (KEOPS) complex  Pcc1 subunit